MDTLPPPRAADGTEALLGACLERLECGDGAGLERLIESHPESSDFLLRRLALLRDVGLLPEPERAEAPPARLGPFQLGDRLGAGAMGVVWRAYQDPPGRYVALKVLRPEQQLFAESRLRFRREVELAARLSHPAILPILAVGEDQGLAWFATELVRGISLEELVRAARERYAEPDAVDPRALSPLVAERIGQAAPGSPWRDRDGRPYSGWRHFALETARTLAEALAHAHARGILHRDVKPQNALIDLEGRVWLADFGLAVAPDDPSISATRVAVGSLPYLAPEVLAGSAHEVRSDVWGLGALLFELLLWRRPFEADQPARLMARIAAGERTRLPAAERRLGPELRAVLDRALAVERRERYADAGAVAADLGNLLAGRPTSARARGPVGLLVAAARRRPWATTALLLAALVSLGGPLVYGLQQRRGARLVALERDRALAAHSQAMAAVERMLSRVGADLAFVPAMEELRRALLEDAVELLERLAAETPPGASGAAALDLVAAHARLGELEDLLGRADRAARAFGAAREEARRLVEDPSLADHLGRAAREAEARHAAAQARALLRLGDLDAADAVLAEAHAHLAAPGPPLPEATRDLLGARLAAAGGLVAVRRGEVRAGLETLGAAAERVDRLLAELDPGAPREAALELAFEIWHARSQEALRLDETGLEEDTERALGRALDLALERAERSSEASRGRDLVSAHINLGGARLRRGRLDDAEALYLAARDDAARLLRDHPAVLTLRSELAGASNQLGLLAEARGDLEAAGTHYDASVEVLEELVRLVPEDVVFLHRLAVGRMNASAPYMRRGDIPAAEFRVDLAFEALHLARQLAPDDADLAMLHISLMGARWVLRHEAGDHRGVSRAAAALAELDLPAGLTRVALHRAAYAHVVAFQLVERDSDLSADEAEALRATYAEAAAETTRRSYRAGNRYPDLTSLRNLQPLHGRPEFQTLLTWFDQENTPSPAPEPR